MTSAQLLTSQTSRAGDDIEAFTLSEEPLKLRSGLLEDVVYLRLRQQFHLVRDDEAPRSRRWRVSTAAYFYQIDDSSYREMLAWHWHPATGLRYPHMHVASSPVGKLTHLPTGRVSVESVIRLLLDDLQVPVVKGRAGDYQKILAKAEGDFVDHRSWHAYSAGRGPARPGT